MRLAILAVLAVFQSCQPEVKPDPQPEAQPQTTQVLGDKLDKADSRVASAVQVAREANTAGKPAKVEAELAVAAAYLPNPQPGDLAFARQRADAADPKAYADAVAYGNKLKADLDSLWQKMEAQQKKSQAEITALKKHCEDKQIELEAARKEKGLLILTGLGAGMIALGVLLLAFGHWVGVNKLSAGLVVLGGVMTAALPWVIESNYFPWVIGVTLSIAAFQGLLAMGVKTYRWLKPSPKPVQVDVTADAMVKQPNNPDNGSSPII
jgi:hypothetical protein